MSVLTTGQHSSVTVNNGSGRRNVLITPLASVRCQTPAVTQPLANPPSTMVRCSTDTTSTIDKATLKAVCPGAAYKKDSARTFILRNIDSAKVVSCADLKSTIRRQLQHDIVSGDFDVGYVGASVVRVRSKEDLVEMWEELRSGKIALWCDGLKEKLPKQRESYKRKQSEDHCDDENSTKKKRHTPEEVQEVYFLHFLCGHPVRKTSG